MQGHGSWSGSDVVAGRLLEQQLQPASRNRTTEFQSLKGKQTEIVEAQFRERMRTTLERGDPTEVRRLKDAESAACDVCHTKLCKARGSHEEDVSPLLAGSNGGSMRRSSA